MKMKKKIFKNSSQFRGIHCIISGCVGDIEDNKTISEHDVNNEDSTKENKNCPPIDNKENKMSALVRCPRTDQLK